VKVLSQIQRYGLAAISCGLALAVAWQFDAPTSCFFLAVMVTSLYGGKGPGLFAVALSSLAFDYFFLPPRFQFEFHPASLLRFGPFLVANLLVVGVIEVKRRAEEARRKIAAQVQRSEAYLAEAQKLSRSGSWASAPDSMRTTYWSEEMFRIVGLPPADSPPAVEEFAALFPPEAWGQLMEMFEAARLKKTTFDGDVTLISKGGTNRTLRIVGHPVLGASGEILEFVGTAIDVTEQRQARAALQRAFDELKGSEDRLRLIIDTIPVPAWSSHPDGSSAFINQRWLDYTGISVEEALGWGWKIVVHPEDLDRTMEYWRAVLADHEERELEARLRRFDGTYRWFLFRVSPLRDESGRIVQWYGTCIDIEDRKRAEQALRASEQNLRLMVHCVAGFLVTSTAAGEVELVNQTLLNYTGKPLEELRNWPSVVHPSDLPAVGSLWTRSVKTGHPFDADVRVRRADGVYRWFHCRGLPLRDNDRRIVRWYTLLTDIEDRINAEDALRNSERELSLIVETMPGLVWCAAPNGELNYVNQRILDYIGTNLQALAQSGWLNFLHPDDVLPTINAWLRAVETGEPHDVQYRLRRFDGTYRWFHVLGQPACDADGHTTRWYGLLIDIDDRKNMEEALRSTQARLSRAAQTATVGELSASIAHEINQPLAAVVANGHACLRWLSAQPPNLAKAHEAAERIVRDGKDAGEIIGRTRALFKRASLEKTALDMNEVIADVLRLTRSDVVRKGVAVETELKPDLPCVGGDRVQLQQLLFNLLINGIEAMEGVTDRPKRLFIRSKQQPGEGVQVEVRDCGPGLAEADKAFEAFYTTKENGLGMGLAICRSIVEAHQGRLWAESADGTGATFCFILPTMRVPNGDSR
jgi:PAS domain S-box-containing protein